MMADFDESISLNDQIVIGMWVARCKTASTQRSYRRYACKFFAQTKKSLASTTSDDIRSYFNSYIQGTIATRATALSAIKSLFSYAQGAGITIDNPGATVVLPQARQATIRRVVDQRDVERMILLEDNERNFAILMTAYSGGLLPSELAGLKWSDTAEQDSGTATIRVIGYKGRMREVRVSAAAWKAISALRGHVRPDEPVFLSKKGGHLGPIAIHRVVKRAVKRAGLPDSMSTYWLRHAQISSSMEDGTPLHLIQAKLGHSDIEVTQRYVQMFSKNPPMHAHGKPVMPLPFD